MENGIKYNIDCGTVEVIVNRLSKEQVSIKIIDTGIGMPTNTNRKYLNLFIVLTNHAPVNWVVQA
ncbi:ATP-binding protein [Paenisporosarcina sp. HGH0030]|uniref:ATP-binding protein n=1 Tax=unclassified Paenisporosarcina TaxID=2642018 RepID=UPI0018CA702C